MLRVILFSAAMRCAFFPFQIFFCVDATSLEELQQQFSQFYTFVYAG